MMCCQMMVVTPILRILLANPNAGALMYCTCLLLFDTVPTLIVSSCCVWQAVGQGQR